MSLWVRVPTNIAFIKYWGKSNFDLNWPVNDSISMSLSSLVTETSCSFIDKDDYSVWFDDVKLDHNDKRFLRVKTFLDWIKKKEGFSGYLEIRTHNSFYSDCGIASSASGFGALSISSILTWTGSSSFQELSSKGFSIKKLEDISRIGSGSSCRSFVPGFAHWKRGSSPEDQSVEQIEDHNWSLVDTIVVVSRLEKKVSSRQGHRLSIKSPYFEQRLVEVKERIKRIIEAIGINDIESFGKIIEEEAISLHKVIETSGLSYRSKECMDFLDSFVNLRNTSKIGAYYTMDAGECVHIICEKKDQIRLKDLLENNFSYEILTDEIGRVGPTIFNKE